MVIWMMMTSTMMTFRTDFGQIEVERSGEGMYLATLPPYGHELYVVAFTHEDAVRKACEFWYHKRTKKLERI